MSRMWKRRRTGRCARGLTPGHTPCEHIRLNRPALLAWRQERRRGASDLVMLQALREKVMLMPEMTSASDLQDELPQQLSALDSTIALLRRRYSL